MSIDYQPTNDIERGREAMKYFHNQAARYEGYDLTMDSMVAQVSKGKSNIFLDSMGFAINQIDMSSSDLKKAMENLADAGQGRVPSNQNAFFKSLSDQSQSVNWVDAVGFVAVESSKEILKGAQEIGNTVIQTASSLGAIIPILAVGALIFVVFSRARKLA